jgi:hypothetical protein
VHLGAQVEPKPSPALAGGHGSTNTAPTTSATFKPAQSTPSTAATPAAPAVSSPYDIAREQGNSHFRAGQYAQAVAAYTAAIETGSGGAVAWTNRAAARLKLREFEAAAVCFTLDSLFLIFELLFHVEFDFHSLTVPRPSNWTPAMQKPGSVAALRIKNRANLIWQKYNE